MKSIKKILTVFTSTCFILGSCDIDPTLTSSYPSVLAILSSIFFAQFAQSNPYNIYL